MQKLTALIIGASLATLLALVLWFFDQGRGGGSRGAVGVGGGAGGSWSAPAAAVESGEIGDGRSNRDVLPWLDSDGATSSPEQALPEEFLPPPADMDKEQDYIGELSPERREHYALYHELYFEEPAAPTRYSGGSSRRQAPEFRATVQRLLDRIEGEADHSSAIAIQRTLQELLPRQSFSRREKDALFEALLVRIKANRENGRWLENYLLIENAAMLLANEEERYLALREVTYDEALLYQFRGMRAMAAPLLRMDWLAERDSAISLLMAWYVADIPYQIELGNQVRRKLLSDRDWLSWVRQQQTDVYTLYALMRLDMRSISGETMMDPIVRNSNPERARSYYDRIQHRDHWLKYQVQREFWEYCADSERIQCPVWLESEDARIALNRRELNHLPNPQAIDELFHIMLRRARLLIDERLAAEYEARKLMRQGALFGASRIHRWLVNRAGYRTPRAVYRHYEWVLSEQAYTPYEMQTFFCGTQVDRRTQRASWELISELSRDEPHLIHKLQRELGFDYRGVAVTYDRHLGIHQGAYGYFIKLVPPSGFVADPIAYSERKVAWLGKDNEKRRVLCVRQVPEWAQIKPVFELFW